MAAESLALHLGTEVEFLRIADCEQGEISRRVAFFTRRGRELALIPGGSVELDLTSSE